MTKAKNGESEFISIPKSIYVAYYIVRKQFQIPMLIPL